MLKRLAHRGPDGEGSVEVAGNWLGHRLHTLDGEASGAPPLATESGDLSIVADAVIVNHEELREALPNTRSRTANNHDVLPHLFETRGPDGFAEVNGMFAFVIAGADGRFIAARDPLGVKPLYWATRDGRTLFASELSAFDTEWHPAVEFFPPGHYWTPESGLVRFAPVVPDVPAAFEPPDGAGAVVPDAILSRVREALIEAVEGQLEGDGEIGVFLSGGLDSSLIAAIAAPIFKKRGKTLRSYAVGLGDAPDLIAARAVAAHLGTEHHEQTYTAEDAVRLLPETVQALENFDPSLVRSAVANYILADFASPHVRAVLTGEGSDEIFAGYEYLVEVDDDEELQRELVEGLAEGHYVGLQRLDRMPMAFGIESRAPFLDRRVVELGFSIPAGWKSPAGGQPEKALLRQAFTGWLPEEFLWRKKSQFGEGSGAVTVLQRQIEEGVTDEEFERERHAIEPPLRTKEELAYYRIFAEHLPGIRPEKTIGRFVTP